jgi:hypothetical protein
LNRLLDRISPWRRGYSEGWDDGAETAALDLDDLHGLHHGDLIPRAEVQAIQTQLRAELDHPH